MGALRGKQAELKAVMDKLAALDADLQEKKNRKEKLESDVHMCRCEKYMGYSGLGVTVVQVKTRVLSALFRHKQCQA